MGERKERRRYLLKNGCSLSLSPPRSFCRWRGNVTLKSWKRFFLLLLPNFFSHNRASLLFEGACERRKEKNSFSPPPLKICGQFVDSPDFSRGQIGMKRHIPKSSLIFCPFFPGKLVCGTTAFGGNKMRLHTEVVLIPLHSRRGEKTFSPPPLLSLKKRGEVKKKQNNFPNCNSCNPFLPEETGTICKKAKSSSKGKERGKRFFPRLQSSIHIFFGALHFCPCWSITIWQSLELHGGRDKKLATTALDLKGGSGFFASYSVSTF